VQIVSITDKQYKKIKIFNGKQREKNEKTNSYCCFNPYATEHYTERRQRIFVFNQLTPIQCSYSEIPVMH
jgi:hypothetical protein